MTLKLIGGECDGQIIEVPYATRRYVVPFVHTGDIIAVVRREKDCPVARYLRVGMTPFAVAL